MRKSPETRLTRRGVYVVAFAAALGGCTVSAAADRLLVKDYGCGTATVASNSDAIDTARQAGAKVAPLNNRLESLIAAQTQAIVGSELVSPGEQITTCVKIDPVIGLGDGGWIVDVNITNPVAHG